MNIKPAPCIAEPVLYSVFKRLHKPREEKYVPIAVFVEEHTENIAVASSVALVKVAVVRKLGLLLPSQITGKAHKTGNCVKAGVKCKAKVIFGRETHGEILKLHLFKVGNQGGTVVGKGSGFPIQLQ